jgi:UDP-N-acetylglucosamine--N-acetylmuramyl-(pentapeptide) pyrophosphoryl-undecaprenol N-acetylglucosamine transferase
MKEWAGRLVVSDISFFFAGGGTGGHIYPAVAVAEQILEEHPGADVHFLCSTKPIDRRILEKAGFEHTELPATGLFFRPGKLVRFVSTFHSSYRRAQQILANSPNPVVIGTGGYVAAPVCLAGHRASVPVVLINVDIVPGRANRLCARWADEVFIQFEDSRRWFHSFQARVHTVGCPLRKSFAHLEPAAAVSQLGLDQEKKTLLVTGASSGSASINEAVIRLLPRLETFAATWQIVHLTGLDNYEGVLARYDGVRIAHHVVSYYDRMSDLYAAADLVIGRSGAVSVAEYAAAGLPSICMPYPHHRDRHQYLNTGKLVEVGAAVIVDDLPDVEDRTGWLWEELEELMTDDALRREMADACKKVARPNAAAQIAQRLLAIASQRSGICPSAA